MIRVEHIQKRFGKLQTLQDVSLQASAGDCIALIGPNGCGKTTLIKCILGLVVPDRGDIYVCNSKIDSGYSYRAHIGYMPQIGRYPENMTIGQLFSMIRDLRGHHTQIDTQLYDEYKIDTMLHKRMRTLSGGTRQKVSAALAFMFGADIFILDEPTAGLDPISSEILKEKIRDEKAKGKLILITSHILSELDDVVSHVMYMQDGQCVFFHDIDALQQQTGEIRLSKALATFMKQNQYHA